MREQVTGVAGLGTLGSDCEARKSCLCGSSCGYAWWCARDERCRCGRGESRQSEGEDSSLHGELYWNCQVAAGRYGARETKRDCSKLRSEEGGDGSPVLLSKFDDARHSYTIPSPKSSSSRPWRAAAKSHRKQQASIGHTNDNDLPRHALTVSLGLLL